MRYVPFITTALCLALLGGCANLAPDYRRPDLPVPASLDGQSTAAQILTIPNWQTVITNTRLQKAVELALSNNRDLRIAILNIQKVRAQYQIAESARYPALGASASGTSVSAGDTITRKYAAGLGVTAYEIDFFGRVGNLKDAALETFLATTATQRSVQTSLIAEVTSAWLTLAANQDLLRLAQDTAASRNRTVDLISRQHALGGTSALSLAQAQASMESARGDVANYTRLVEQSRNALNLLAGAALPDETLPEITGNLGDSMLALVEVPAGLSSMTLLQRPDIVAAEHTLVGAYANIGAARAAFFPSITLTGSAGTASASLGNLFAAGSGTWSFIPTLNLPIFNAGKLNAALSVAEADRDIQVASYEKAVQTAFREVADALSERRTMNDRLSAQQAEVDAYATSLRLSTERYRAGADSYLTVLDSQRSLYTAQKSLISLNLSEQGNRMTLFKVLGGS